jgi:Protein phosphatase 2C
MPMSADAAQRPVTGSPDSWLAVTASQLGAVHLAVGLPNQDAVAARQVGPDGLVTAVADGHGHHRHFRSARGSALAVAVACDAAQELTTRLDRLETTAQIESDVAGTLIPAILGRWRVAVREDLAAEPFTAEEEAARAPNDDALIAYGSTLLLAIARQDRLVLTQIGDGDVVGIRPGGQALLPVPGDPSLDGRQTTSLCGPRAEAEFRVGVVDTAQTPLLGVLVATDGYGNAQVAEPWTDAVSADLAELIRDRSAEWLAGQLPLWASRCASAEGSADDTTIALLIAPAAALARLQATAAPEVAELPEAARRLARPLAAAAAVGESAAERERRLAKSAAWVGVKSPETPAVPAAAAAAPPAPATLSAGPGAPPAGELETPPAPPPPGRRRRPVMIAGVLVVIAAALVLLALHHRHAPPAVAIARCSPPSSAVGKPVTATVITACDTSTHRTVRISTAGLPAGARVALQTDNSIFVLVNNALWWTPVAGKGRVWTELGPVPAGVPQALCVSGGSVIVAANTSTSSSATPAASWTEVSVPAKSPVKVGPPSHVASNVCAGGLSQ